jgi:hypothetical protein
MIDKRKDAFYFSHDSNARNDDKLIAVRMKHDWKGYGLFWAIIEKMREANNYVCVRDYNIIAYDLRTDASTIKSIIEDFGLFAFTEDGKCFYSERLNLSMEIKEEKSAKAKESAKKRWDLEKLKNQNDANALPPHTDSNAIKDKLSKEKEIKDKLLLEKEAKGKLKFSPPSLLEIQNEISIKNYLSVSSASFFNFYESKDWFVGKNKMKSWQMALAGWESRNKEKHNQNFNNGKPNANNKTAFVFNASEAIETITC